MDVFVYCSYHAYSHDIVIRLVFLIAAAVIVFFVALVDLVLLAVLIALGVGDACMGQSKLALRVPPAVTRLTVYRWLHIEVLPAPQRNLTSQS